MLVCNCS